MIAIVAFKAILNWIDHASQRVKMIDATMMSGSFAPKKGERPFFTTLRAELNGQTYNHISIWVHIVSSAIVTKVLPAANNYCWRQK